MGSSSLGKRRRNSFDGDMGDCGKMYLLARATIKYHKLGYLIEEIDCLKVLEARSPGPRNDQGWSLLRAVREGSVSGASPWLVDGHFLPVSSHGLPSMPAFRSSSYKDTRHIGLGLILVTPF